VSELAPATRQVRPNRPYLPRIPTGAPVESAFDPLHSPVELKEILFESVGKTLDTVELECCCSLAPGAAISDGPDGDSRHQDQQHPEKDECLTSVVHGATVAGEQSVESSPGMGTGEDCARTH
jgi:hypothetical protein